MTDPYRSTSPRPCPACGQGLVANTPVFACTKGCGEWIPASMLRALTVAENVGEVLSFEGFADQVQHCPDCRSAMDGWIWSNAVFRRCRRHGVWLEQWARTRFHALLAADDEREKAVRRLADSLQTDEGRIELARRLMALEKRVEQLEKK